MPAVGDGAAASADATASRNPAAQAEPAVTTTTTEQTHSTKPVEMENLPPTQPSTATEAPTLEAEPPTSTASEQRERIDLTPETPAQPAPLTRSETAEIALGPDGAAPSTAAINSSEPVLRITLMLITGARHPYVISNKYLTSRKVTALDNEGKFDPREMSAYKLKELIWVDWRPEWEPKPRDPGAIRLIIMGRLLDDKSQLKDSPFSLENTNVVHMTVKPADFLDDDAEVATKSTTTIRMRGRSDGEEAGCCRCVVS